MNLGQPTFHFRVKFYTSEPINLSEELTRYQFFLQLKQDILQGKMPCPNDKAIKVKIQILEKKILKNSKINKILKNNFL